ncbi:CPBP family intramembrane metalloprotease [Clostridium sp. SHJSY1]|uniref:CPBP family intramembrane glutamic endopeptidase n=1 Tax=Clostridium sp. SHJSY1 TaxID=2942483 RepID=UPI002874A0B5|nr:type II CAAX endopeptidase family protein [Clostridium sp. SHJSY1]MDS0527273.1 CPBP family intramembrane metalloprotease [Clostridium sp. SHJSY1]
MKKIFNLIINPLANVENESFQFKLGFWKGLGALCIMFLLTIFFTIFSSIILGDNPVLGKYTVIGIVEIISIPLLIFILTNTFGKLRWKKNTYKKVNKKLLLFIILLILVFRLLFDAYIYPLVSLLPENEVLNETSELLEHNLLYLIISACFYAPIVEEVVFRGIILGGLLKKYSPKIALPISAFLFAFAHLNLQQGINAFLLGIVLGYIYYKTKSIYLTIFGHFSNNVLAFLVYIPSGMTGLILNLVISTVICVPIIILLKKKFTLNYEEHLVSTLNPNKKIFLFEEIE